MATTNTHVDINFVLNRNDPSVPVISDCTTGIGESEEDRARWAVTQWSMITLHPIIELLRPEGRLAYHSDGNDDIGIPGWHSIIGDLFGWAKPNDAAEQMQHWFGTASVLPTLAPVLEPEFEGRPLSWVRFFFGGNGEEDISELRINGTHSVEASERFWAMNWPRPTSVAYLKMFVLVMPQSNAGSTTVHSS